jgi:maleate isomerase
MLVNTFFEWEGKKWAATRKDVNPFFAHPFVCEITCRVTERFMETRWKDSFACDFLEESHNIVKHAVIDLLGGYKLDAESEKQLNDIIVHFIDRNLTEASATAPTLNEEDTVVFNQIVEFAGKVLEYNKAKVALDGATGISAPKEYDDTVQSETDNDANKVHPNGLVYLMLKAGTYTDTEIINIFVNLVVAGGETPALAACKTLAAMARDRSIIEKAQQEVDKNTSVDTVTATDLDNLPYLEMCIMEGMRRYAPATVVGRLVAEDTELAGIPLKKGTQLQVSIHAVQMDPAIWPDPEIFDPSRFEEDAPKHKYGMVAFGVGLRSCPGKAAYIKMAKAMLACILKKYDVSTQSSQDDMDAFLPNRFVGWNTSGIHFEFQRRSATHAVHDQPQDGESDFEFDCSFDCAYDRDRLPTLGLVVLQSDETLENDVRRLFGTEAAHIHVTRVPSDTQVSTDKVLAMAENIEEATSLFPVRANFKVVAYCCTSATAMVGPERIESLVRSGSGSPIDVVTNPLSAFIEACRFMNITRVGLVSPYVAEIFKMLQVNLVKAGIDVISYGSFEQEEEFLVARIGGQSIVDAAVAIARHAEKKNTGMEAIIIACTNLQTLSIVNEIERATNLPCLSSNLVLCWHMAATAGITLDEKYLGSSMLLERQKLASS